MTPAVSSATSVTPALDRQRSAGFDLTAVASHGRREFHLTFRPLRGEGAADMMQRLASALKEHQASVVRQEVFGRLEGQAEAIAMTHRLLGKVDWPLTFIEGAACGPGLLAGMHVMAVAGCPVETVSLGNCVVGRSFSDRWAKHLLLGGL